MKPEHLFVEGKGELRVNAALEKNSGPSQIDRLLDFLADLIEGQDVGLGILRGRTIERAELATVDADVCVVDVAIDDVGRDLRVVLPVANLVGRGAEREEISLLEQRHRVGLGETLSREGSFEDPLRRLSHVVILARPRTPAPGGEFASACGTSRG